MHLLILWVRSLAGQAGPCGVNKAQWWSADGQAGLEASKMASFSQWASRNSWKARALGPRAGHRPPPHPAQQSHMVRILPRQLRTPAVSIPEGLLRAQSWNLPSCPHIHSIPLVKHIDSGRRVRQQEKQNSYPSPSTLELCGPRDGLRAAISLHLIQQNSPEGTSWFTKRVIGLMGECDQELDLKSPRLEAPWGSDLTHSSLAHSEPT